MEFNLPNSFIDWLIFLVYCALILLAFWSLGLLAVEFWFRRGLKHPIAEDRNATGDSEETIRRCAEWESILNNAPTHWKRLDICRAINELTRAKKISPEAAARLGALRERLDAELSRKLMFPGIYDRQHTLIGLICVTVSIVLLGIYLCRHDMVALIFWLLFYFGLSFLAFLTPIEVSERGGQSALYKWVGKYFSGIDNFCLAMTHKLNNPEYETTYTFAFVNGYWKSLGSHTTFSPSWVAAVVTFIALWIAFTILFVLVFIPILDVIGLVRNYVRF